MLGCALPVWLFFTAMFSMAACGHENMALFWGIVLAPVALAAAWYTLEVWLHVTST